MAPILMFVAWNMSARKAFVHILSIRTGDSLVLLTTFLLTIFVNLTVAVQVGIIIAVISFLRKMVHKLHLKVANTSEVEIIKFGKGNPATLRKYILDGPLFFGTAKIFEDAYPVILSENVKTIILDMEHTSVIDATGGAAFSDFIDDARKADIELVIKRLPKEKIALFKKSGLYEKIGEENFFM